MSWFGRMRLALLTAAESYSIVRLVHRLAFLVPARRIRAAAVVDSAPDDAPEPFVDDVTLIPVFRQPPPGSSRRWVALLTATAPIAAVGLYAHHRRFVGYHAYKGLPQQTSFGTWLRAESLGAGTLGWWTLTGFRHNGLRVPPNAAGRPVLCVHGYGQNPTNFVGLRRVLEAAGRPTVAVSLRHRLAPLDRYAERLAEHIRTMAEQWPDGLDIVAHSMGGVVLRLVLHTHPDLRASVRTVITLGSPHRGTASTRGIPLLPELVALRRRSVLLRDLPQLPELLPHGRVVTIAGDTDTMVYPVETSLVPGAEAVVLPGIGHAGLLTSPQSWAAIQQALDVAA